MAKNSDTPVIHILELSFLASEVLLAIVEEYQAIVGSTSGTIVLSKNELIDMFDNVIAKDVLTNMKEYGTDTNLRGLVTAVEEVDKQIDLLDNEDVIELDFTRVLEVL